MMPDIDDSSWPIVKVTYPPFVTAKEIPLAAARLRAIFAKRGPMVTVSDISAIDVKAATPVLRKMVAEEADRLARAGAFIAEATIIRNPLVRILHVGHAWLRVRKDHPTAAFSDWPSALQWARERAGLHRGTARPNL
jgi:hypothetical protein